MDKLAPVKLKIQEIRADNKSGAAELTKKAADVFIAFSKIKVSNGKEFLPLLYSVSKDLIQSQPSMASILNLANRILTNAEELSDIRAIRQGIEAEAQGFVNDMNAGLENIVSEGLNVMKNVNSSPSVLAYSYSSTVLSAILAAKKSGLEPAVVCTESRPTLEGKRLAKNLRNENIPVTYVVDMLAFSLMKDEKIDLVLVGGDGVSAEGLVNKIGTLGLAVFANKFRIPFYALVGTEKLLPLELMPYFKVESRDPEEVLITDDEEITVINRYFDTTPLHLLDGVITESGVWGEEKVRGRAESERVSNRLLSWLSTGG